MDLERVLVRLGAAFQEARIDFALIGGLALAAHGAARATADLDLLADGARDADVQGDPPLKPTREELESLREDGLSEERRRAFAASRAAVSRWQSRHPGDLESALAWMAALRRAFGDPPVDRRPWRGSDFRL